MKGFLRHRASRAEARRARREDQGTDRAGDLGRDALRRLRRLPRQGGGGARRDARGVIETLGMAIYMGAGPSVMYASHALGAATQFAEAKAA